MIKIFLGLVLCSAGALAETAPPQPGWVKKSKSLLYYDTRGTPAVEIGLGRWEDSDPAGLRVKLIDAAACSTNRFAWTLETNTLWNTAKTKFKSSQRILRFWGPDGKEIWNDEEADFIPASDPLAFSQDGRTCLLALRRKTGWFVATKTYVGNTSWEIGPLPQLKAVQLSANGRYGLARWSEPDKSATHSFLDLASRLRKDVPSEKFFLGKTSVDDLGQAYAGGQLVFSFNADISSHAVISSSASIHP